MKRENNQIKIGDALNELMDQYKLKGKLNEIKLYEAWDNILGKAIANHTVSKHLYEDKLLIKLDSAALRNELSYSKSKLVKSLNDAIGFEIVRELVLS